MCADNSSNIPSGRGANRGPRELGDHEPDRDERLHVPQLVDLGLVRADQEREVVRDDRRGRSGERANILGRDCH